MFSILCISLFALDVVDPLLSIWVQLPALFMHLLPSAVLAIVLGVAWRRGVSAADLSGATSFG